MLLSELDLKLNIERDGVFNSLGLLSHHDPEKLMKVRYKGRGVRTIFTELFEYVFARNIQTRTLLEVNRQFRLNSMNNI